MKDALKGSAVEIVLLSISIFAGSEELPNAVLLIVGQFIKNDIQLFLCWGTTTHFDIASQTLRSR